jgi:hypothetical protein
LAAGVYRGYTAVYIDGEEFVGTFFFQNREAGGNQQKR